MRPGLILATLVLTIAGCTNHNLLGEEIWSDEKLTQAEVSFGWNFKVDSQEASVRNIDIIIFPDNSYQVELLEQQLEASRKILSRTDGELSPVTASKLRRSLARLRSSDKEDLFTTMPKCPETSHPAIEYYVGFYFNGSVALTVLDRRCETQETIEGRKLVSEAMAAFPQVSRPRLLAGSIEL